MFAGLPIRVSDPLWKAWLAQAPVTAGTTLLDAMKVSRHMHRWLASAPSPELISATERREIGQDLLHLCDQLAHEVRVHSSAGGTALGIAVLGGAISFAFPPATPAILLGTLVIGGAFTSNAWNQIRRQKELDAVIKLTRKLAWKLRR